MKTPYVSELVPNQLATGLFLVQTKEIRQKKTGEPYLSLTLTDRTGDLDAKMWDNVQEVLEAFERDNFIRVKGMVAIFQNRPQLTIHRLQLVADSEIDISDFLPASKRDRDEMFAELRGWIERMTNPYLRSLLDEILSDEKIALAYRTAPAAKSVHHGWIGGLLEHVLSLCQIARFTASHYPDVDFDLLLTGVVLHDIGKIYELTYARSLGYSTIGQLLGHITIGIRMVEEAAARVPNFPPLLRDLVVHMILSHHGALEYGSPKLPMFLEAQLLHQIDNMDSKMEAMRAHVEKDRQATGVWTGWNAPLARVVLKKKLYLDPPQVTQGAVSQALVNQAVVNSATGAGSPVAPGAKPVPQSRPETTGSLFGSKLQNALGKDS